MCRWHQGAAPGPRKASCEILFSTPTRLTPLSSLLFREERGGGWGEGVHSKKHPSGGSRCHMRGRCVCGGNGFGEGTHASVILDSRRTLNTG